MSRATKDFKFSSSYPHSLAFTKHLPNHSNDSWNWGEILSGMTHKPTAILNSRNSDFNTSSHSFYFSPKIQINPSSH